MAVAVVMQIDELPGLVRQLDIREPFTYRRADVGEVKVGKLRTVDVTPLVYVDHMETATRTPETAAAAEQPKLPFAPLPYDDEADRPIAYGLTARARRTVAPASVPELAVVDGGQQLEDPSDTRPARARALRRAGFHSQDIAEQLSVDELLVRAWVSGITPRMLRQRSRTSPAERSVAAAAASAVADDDVKHAELRSIRASAQSDAQFGLIDQPQFAMGLGLMAAAIELDDHAALLTFRNPTIARRVMEWLSEHEPRAISRRRMVLKIGPDVAGDFARHHWSATLDIEPAAITLARWRHAPTPESVELLVRISDPIVAARLAGWCDALHTGPTTQEHDVSF